MAFYFEAIEYPRGKTPEQFLSHVVNSAIKAGEKGYRLEKIEMHDDPNLRQHTAMIHYTTEVKEVPREVRLTTDPKFGVGVFNGGVRT